MHPLAQLHITSSKIDPLFRDQNTFIGNLVSRLLVYAILAAGMYFLVRTVLAGFTYLTSFGNPGKIQEAQQTLIHSLVGLIIIISAFFLAQIIQVVFGVKIII